MKNRNRSRQLTIFPALLSLCLISCGKDPSPAPIPHSPGAPVYVVCEGAFGSGNSALTVYYPDSGRTVTNAFADANGHSLGDVFQSMALTTLDAYLLCINNSDRVILMSRGSFLELGTVTVPKPRYAVQVSDTKAYISSLYSGKVYILNPRTMTVTGSIDLPRKNPEALLLHGKTLYIATWDSAANAVYPVDTATNQVGAAIPIAGYAPHDLAEDAEGMIWVLAGNKPQGRPATLTRLNPATGAALKTYSFGTADPLRLELNPTKDSLYFIEVSYTGGSADNGVYRMGIHDAALPAQAFIGASASASSLQYFYGIGIHPRSGNIYVADPRGFTQQGRVIVYRPDGVAVDTFNTGVGPGHFVFE